MYFVIKREKCSECDEDGLKWFSNSTADPPVEPFPMPCRPCDSSGYVETRVDLLDVLAKVRWTEVGPIITDAGQSRGVIDLQFNNLRIEE